MAERLLPSNYSSVPSSGIIVKLFPVAISVFLDGSQRYSLMGKSADKIVCRANLELEQVK